VTDREWQGDGPHFLIEAAGRPWGLDLDEAQPGLRWSDARSTARLLALHHIAAPGRRDERAFERTALVSLEHHRGRVRATFAPRGWHGLTVRATWEPTPHAEGFDLEVQVTVTSPGVLRRVEVAVASSWALATTGRPPAVAYRVEPRDVLAAALSYDGREPPDVLHSLTTLPVPPTFTRSLSPQMAREPGPPRDRWYLELVQPNDCARRIIGEASAPADAAPGGISIRYGLFGHDLEKGVVLRGRVRGSWIDSPSPEPEARRRLEAFVSEPPPLGP
jgi:hypothetical protein